MTTLAEPFPPGSLARPANGGPEHPAPWESLHVSGSHGERTEDRLLAALFVAAAVHAVVILGVTFTKPTYPDVRNSTLDVVLVQHRSERQPDDAAYLAPANQDGGGDLDDDVRPATPLPAPLTGPTAEVVTTSAPALESSAAQADAAQEEPAAIESEAQILARADDAPEAVVRRPPKPRPRPKSIAHARPDPAPEVAPAPDKPEIDAITLVTNSLAYASLNAEVDRRLAQYASKPRRKWITARTRESKYAAYMDAWRAKVERIGNLNYPDAARRERLAGSLLLDVALNADGSVSDVSLRRSSGHRVLDDAAVRIVKLAAPFAPLPADIRRETDILHIERTWQFLSSHRLSSP